jgi:hypothetical protein
VITGTLASTDAAAATLGLKSRSGIETPYRVTEKTLLWREKKPAELSAFRTGEKVVVRFRKSSVGPATLYDLADEASWGWVDRLRHETSRVTIKEIDDESLHAMESSAEFDYRITEKTEWSRAGKPAAPTDFKAGEIVHVVPRLLPGGGTMAVVVSDASTDAAKLKERSRFTVSGTIRTWNAAARTLAIHTAAADDREFILTPDCVVRQSGKDVPVAYLRPGLSATLHLTRDESGEQVVRQVTLKGKATAKRLPSKSGGKVSPVKPG